MARSWDLLSRSLHVRRQEKPYWKQGREQQTHTNSGSSCESQTTKCCKRATPNLRLQRDPKCNANFAKTDDKHNSVAMRKLMRLVSQPVVKLLEFSDFSIFTSHSASENLRIGVAIYCCNFCGWIDFFFLLFFIFSYSLNFETYFWYYASS